jgi:hypothetical protein
MATVLPALLSTSFRAFCQRTFHVLIKRTYHVLTTSASYERGATVSNTPKGTLNRV